jgi:hypothetical protein
MASAIACTSPLEPRGAHLGIRTLPQHGNPDTHFLLIADDELTPEITADVERRGWSGHVTFLRDIFSIPGFMLSAMNCYVFPSLYEGLPLVTVEAQAADLPGVFSDRFTREAIVDPKLVTVLTLHDSAGR